MFYWANFVIGDLSLLNCDSTGSNKHLISKETNIKTRDIGNEIVKQRQSKRVDNYNVLHCLDSGQLILDVNSVHSNLHLSEGNRAATMKSEPKNYPDHPDRFDHWQQVRIYCQNDHIIKKEAN